MADFILIAGACHRAGVWRDVLAPLAALGHSAQAMSLHGDSLAQNVQAILAACPMGAFLVGHSAGGFVAHGAALAQPDHVGGVIYLCAFIPQHSQSVATLRRAAPQDAIGPAIRRYGAHYGFDPDAAQPLFFHDCPNPAAHVAGLQLDPIAPMQSALPDLPNCVPRAAILCENDRAIDIAYQAQMAADIQIQARLPCGHAPFFAMPDLLAQQLDNLATKLRRV